MGALQVMGTVLLAAGQPDYRNAIMGHGASPSMAIVNGRPVIVWVLADLLKHTEGEVVVVVRHDDTQLIQFLERIYRGRACLQVVKQTTDGTILDSVQAGLHSLTRAGPVRVVLGDTLLRGVPFSALDRLCVAPVMDASEKWCMADIGAEEVITGFADKQAGLDVTRYRALVGRYEFADGHLFKACVAKADGRRELSDALNLYNAQRPMQALEIKPSQWIDFGHIEGLAKAKAMLMEARAFNSIQVNTQLATLVKRSDNVDKLRQEAYWYQNLPAPFEALAPRVFGFREAEDHGEITMEYYGYPTLTEKFVYADLAPTFWQSVLENLLALVARLQAAGAEADVTNTCTKMYAGKTFERLATLRDQHEAWPVMLDAPEMTVNGTRVLNVAALTDFIEAEVARLTGDLRPGVVHGDLCFNNILYDAASGVCKLIDPRGEFGAGMSLYGDPRYDVAKLRHSYCGRYDMIVEGLFELLEDDRGVTLAFSCQGDGLEEQRFDEVVEKYGYNAWDIRFIEALLFLSMLPLHHDSLKKQKAFFYQGLLKLNACYRLKENLNENLHRSGRHHLRTA